MENLRCSLMEFTAWRCGRSHGGHGNLLHPHPLWPSPLLENMLIPSNVFASCCIRTDSFFVSCRPRRADCMNHQVDKMLDDIYGKRVAIDVVFDGQHKHKQDRKQKSVKHSIIFGLMHL